MSFINKYYSELVNEANKSPLEQQLAAGILKDKKLVSKICCNSNKTFCRGELCGSLHAEARVLLNHFNRSLQFNKSKNKWCLLQTRKKFNIIVIRISKSGTISNARPCYNCLNMMKDIGIKKVYYSTGNNDELICEHIKNMISIQVSIAFLNMNKLKNNNNEYYNYLLKKEFPKSIKNINLQYFIDYNLKNILPNYKVIIKSNLIQIFDNKNYKIIESQIEN